ncbi:DUF1801 domain-containing protein [Novosphingobium sp. B 225]|uniref:DUF1801 domain-containing protein n=1 Tax=Novosphingobium sp. B 225 TaxID=1961849 RepID=UPI000B4A5959|nr:DUF1801 domain-containing protein [Novosphingobium sp. B 225]
MDDAEARLDGFLARYLPAVAALGRGAIRHLRARLPGCDALVYDNYQALAVGFSPDGKTGSAIVSVALYPRWVSLFFLQAQGLKDYAGLLQGSGTAIRHIRLSAIEDLDQPAVRALIEAALDQAKVPYSPDRTGNLVIKSVSAKQKPRRPAST